MFSLLDPPLNRAGPVLIEVGECLPYHFGSFIGIKVNRTLLAVLGSSEELLQIGILAQKFAELGNPVET